MRHHDILIENAHAAKSQRVVTSPFDGREIATVAEADLSHVELALDNAYRLYSDRNEWLSVKQRVEIFENAISLMQQRKDELIDSAAMEGGKPYKDSVVEVERAIDGMKLAIETIRTEHGRVIPMGADAYSANRVAFTQKEPIGVVSAISAFNHPLNLIVHQAGAALAAGCPTIIKPADDTPISCFNFINILKDSGLPPHWCQGFVTSGMEAAEKLATDGRVAFLSFIGSARVGWMLRSKLPAGTRCALEHGGIAPVLVYPDANIAEIAPLLAKGGFYHAGQVCVSVQRIFAHSDIASDLASAIAEIGCSMVVGDPLSPATDVGPLIREKEVQRVHSWVEEAVSGGTKLICGGEPLADNPRCYKPTVLLNPRPSAKVSTQEIFGPVICVYSCENMDQAYVAANETPFAFQASVFTKDLDLAFHAYRHLNASAVMLNEHTAFRIDGMPFAGLKSSGLGVGGLPRTIEDMQIEKMLVAKSPALP